MPKFRDWIASRSAATLASDDELYVRDASGDVSQRTTYGALTAVADAHIADTTDAHDASAVSITDAAGNYTATDVEGALAELPSQFAPLDTASVLAGGGSWAVVGDSISVQATSEETLWHGFMNILSRGGFRRTYQGATAGHTVAQMETANKAAVLALNPLPDYCVIFGGTNGSLIADLTDFATDLEAGGVTPVLVLIPPQLSSGTPTSAPIWNAQVSDLAASNGWPLLDAYTPLVDPSTGYAVSALMDDAVHPNGDGHRAIALHNLTSPRFMSQFARPRVVYTQPMAGATNLIPSDYGLFAADTNADGVSDGFSTLTLSGGASFSRSEDADGVWWQRMTLPSGTPLGLIYATISSGFTAGTSIIEVAFRLTSTVAAGLTSAPYARVMIEHRSSAPAVIRQDSMRIRGSITDGIMRARVAVPASTATIRVYFNNAGTVVTSGYAEIAQLTVRTVDSLYG